MKRNERTTYNQLKKTVTTGTIYVEIPLTWTHEARQAIHELLTIEKGMYASCIGPEVISGAECIRYTHASEYTAQTRQEQESTDVDEVVQSLHRTEYTWNGYKPTTDTTDTTDTTTAQPEGKKEEKKMTNATNEAKKALLTINPHALQGLHSLIGYDFQQPHAIARIKGRFTVNSALKAVGGADRENVVTLLAMDHSRSYLDRLNLITVDSLARIDVFSSAIDGLRLYTVGGGGFMVAWKDTQKVEHFSKRYERFAHAVNAMGRMSAKLQEEARKC